MHAYEKLTNLFSEQAHLNHALAICQWDEAVMMPEGGGEARAKAMASFRSLTHRLLTDPKIGELLNQAQAENLPSPWEHANLKWMHITYKKACCLPNDLVKHMTFTYIQAEQAWRQLRKENNWAKFAPYLEANIKIAREVAQIKANTFNVEPYDALIDDFAPGVNQALINPIFKRLKEFLPNFIQQVIAQQQTPRAIEGRFPIEKQKKLGMEIMRSIGFDFQHGRLDVSHHPFCGGVPQDVRITTRYLDDEFISAIMGICHETGHAMYERGLPAEWLEQPVGESLGMAMHESQSLLFEMQACRSNEFCSYLAKRAQHYFDDNPVLAADNLYRTFTHVKPGLIRVDADEVCYPLHIILRYEIEQQLIADTLQVRDLPEIWNTKMQTYLGLGTKGNDKDGVMQDVHWPAGLFGYFPSYTLGAIIAAQLFQAACTAIPDIHSHLKMGQFTTLLDWLRANVHSKGRLLHFNDLLQQATGKPLSADFFIRHLQKRYLSHIS